MARTVLNWPDECDPREPCFGSQMFGQGLPAPWKWAVRINLPALPPDELPKNFYVESVNIPTDIRNLTYVRQITTATRVWDFQAEVFIPAPLPDPVIVTQPISLRWTYSNNVDPWTSVTDLVNQFPPRSDLWQPQMALNPPTVPPPPPGTWIQNITLRGLAYFGNDALAQYRADTWP